MKATPEKSAVGGWRGIGISYSKSPFDQATELCLGRCVRDRKVCRFNWLTR